MINFVLLHTYFGYLLSGALVALEIAVIALFIGIVGGTLLALAQLYGNTLLRIIGHIYITIIRGTPMLVQMITLFYLFPLIGIVMSPFWSAVVAIGLNSIAYVSQIVRAGILSVGIGQIEAAQTLGFSPWQIIRLIILPQAFRAIFPALGNESVMLIKDSSLASVIGVAELTHQGSVIMSITFDALTVYAGVALMYLVMTSAVSLVLHLVEQRLAYAKN
ncbi:MAG: amino acid ABC transporter permease [Candidatus Dependentiae bacterium]|nr:amino acid ABC transporter permease [Candidatus Dependentiae bacterium]MCL5876045.1 amino acid ABC transporter permease [Candidatus Dependentiae bacterium]